MRVFFRLGNTQLRETVILNDLAHRILDRFRRKSNACIHAVFVLRKRCKRNFQTLVALETVKGLIDKSMRKLARAVGTEVEEDSTIAILHACIALDNKRNDELIVDACRIARLNTCRRIICCNALSMRNGFVRLFLAIPTIIAIHGIIAAADRSN